MQKVNPVCWRIPIPSGGPMIGLPPAVSLPCISRLIVGCVPTLLCRTRIPNRAARSGIVVTSLSMIRMFIVPALLMPVAMMPLPAVLVIVLFEIGEVRIRDVGVRAGVPTEVGLHADAARSGRVRSLVDILDDVVVDKTIERAVAAEEQRDAQPLGVGHRIGDRTVVQDADVGRGSSPTAVTAIMLLPTLSMSFPLMTNGLALVPRVDAALLALVSVTSRMPLPPIQMSMAGAVSRKRNPEMVLFWIAPVVMPPVGPARTRGSHPEFERSSCHPTTCCSRCSRC